MQGTRYHHILDINYLFNDHATIVLAITVVFGGTGGTEDSPSKDKGAFKKWLDRLADAAEVLPAIIESVVGAILSFSWESYWICS